MYFLVMKQFRVFLMYQIVCNFVETLSIKRVRYIIIFLTVVRAQHGLNHYIEMYCE